MFEFSLHLFLVIVFISMSSYLLGSIPFGFIVSKLNGIKDIRKFGSGNIGATNVLRTGKKKLALLTLILDSLKGYLSVVIIDIIFNFQILTNYLYLINDYKFVLISFAGFFSIFGHCFPLWLKFKGGKGVATGFGVILAFDPLLGGINLLIWLLTFLFTKISSLSAIIAFFFVPFFFIFYVNNLILNCTSILISLLICFKHKENIIRLINKEEKKF